jgi:sortase A
VSTYAHEVRTHRAPPRRARTATLTTLAVLLAIIGVAGARILYVITRDAAVVEQGQHTLDAQLAQQWAGEVHGAKPEGPAGPAPLGKGVWRLWIPRLGLSWVVVEGVDPGDIAAAPGHYPGSAQPGQVGNVAIAGHREIGMFADLDLVKPGDAIVLEERTEWITYRVVSARVVPPASWAEVAEVPPGFTSGQRLITLTTCWPRFDSTSRLIVRGVLERTSPHDAPPKELA